MQVVIPFKTPTINHLYFHKNNIKILKTEARKLQAQIKEIVGLLNISSNLFIYSARLKVITEIYENWFYLNGDIANKDISNREKFLIDSIFKALEVDDKQIFEHIMRKVQSENEEKAVITIDEI